ncbi:MAG: 4-hydroxybutyrate CoA-transferase [Cyanobacteriota bacterium erpe_2018_sw_21hr_WHONDRS-SW48-000092_B_bin.40]|jgi:acetyl-CoA hydrolase|nr:4-hydroxybutyrate CoA-transferase [Cyanobacteriota bacterium erpe_2018_sw_21hr_WHONDRS-SW48-000092_B_bin.40]
MSTDEIELTSSTPSPNFSSASSAGSWQERYQRKIVTASEAAQKLTSGDAVYIHSNAAAPASLIEGMLARAPHLRDVTILHLLTMGRAEYARKEFGESFRVHALFIGENVRKSVNEGRADYMPVFLSEIPALFERDIVPVDVCMIQVSPPDAHGYCSYGVSVDCTIAARRKARIVIAEVNKQMPRTLGRAFVHVDKFDYVVECDRELPELLADAPTSVEEAIGRNVASLIEDGATLQLGIGSIPNAILLQLGDKRDLGIHSEMLSDGVIDLIEKGIVTNDAKTVLPGKIAVSFVIGSRRLYDFVNDNPLFEFQTSDYINDPFVISQNHKMTAINSALQIDVTGQVAADSIGDYLYSGVGGQVDFIRGAARAKNGKAIIALPSTAKHGTVSRIVANLAIGSGVVTSRADVHYVVTEFGIAQLYGKTLKERMQALIAIAHPDFRDKLEADCELIHWH